MISTYSTHIDTDSFMVETDIEYGYQPGETVYSGEREYFIPGDMVVVSVKVKYIKGHDSVGEMVYEHTRMAIEPAWLKVLDAWAFRYIERQVDTVTMIAEEMRANA